MDRMHRVLARLTALLIKERWSSPTTAMSVANVPEPAGTGAAGGQGPLPDHEVASPAVEDSPIGRAVAETRRLGSWLGDWVAVRDGVRVSFAFQSEHRQAMRDEEARFELALALIASGRVRPEEGLTWLPAPGADDFEMALFFSRVIAEFDAKTLPRARVWFLDLAVPGWSGPTIRRVVGAAPPESLAF